MGNEKADKPISAAPKFQIYNSETGELLGRTAGSWAKIGLFYIAYFAFLAGLFTASIQIMKTGIDLKKPKLQTRLNIPGLHYFPKIDPESDEQTARLKENEGVAFYWDSQNTQTSKFYSDIVATEKQAYDYKKGNNTENTQGVTDFDWSTMGECGESTDGYGWGTTEPCIFFRLNRIIGWEPVGLFKPQDDTFFADEGNGPKQAMQEDAVYIRCRSKFIGKEEDGVEVEKLTFDYFGGAVGAPSDGYISKEGFYPYKGKIDQPFYQSPIVAVKVKGLKDTKQYRVKCQAYAKNIIIDTRDNLGHIQFEIQHGGQATKSE
jgi:sodium/potassium-transporting ATPase subunit beta